MWIDIWEKMKKLNSRILRERRYLSYDQICDDTKQTPTKIDWTLNYTRALIHEVAEYFDETDSHKEKIELIDILFFLVSVLQVAGWDVFTFEQLMQEEHTPYKNYEFYPENMIFTAIEIENSIAWKHWKSYTFGIHPNKFHDAILDFVEDWKEHTFIVHKMTPTQIHQAFLDKLDVNHKRQDGGYTKKKKDDDIHVRTSQ
jgi:NTP pyrophosphatase (non-canonical NTP hydrolase)